MKKTTNKLLLSAGVSALVMAVTAVSAIAQDAPSGNDTAVGANTPADNTLVIVTARRKALKSAIEIKKNADTIVDSIVADEAGALPDTSVTEVLQRVSGVTVSRFTASNGGTPSFQIEGTGVAVRGLPYNASTLNGRQAFSANGANSLSWGDITPELMGGVDVYKASRADLIEGGASSIDLRTRLPFDYKKPEFDLSLGVSYGDQIRKSSPEASALYTRRFDTSVGEMGILIDLAHSQYHSQNSNAQIGPYLAENNPNRPDDFALVPNGYSWSQGSFQRDRDGAYAAFQWKPSDTLTLTSTLFYSQYKTDSLSRGGSWGNNPNGTTENIPVDASYDSAGGMQSGSLYVGASGVSNPVFGWSGNNFLAQYWNPSDPNFSWISFLNNRATILNADCRSQYGSLSSSVPTVNWGLWDQPGMFSCQASTNANNVIGLNLGGSTSVSKNTSSTFDFSQSFTWWASDKMRVKGGLQYVYSLTNGRSLYAGITQSDPNLSSATFDATKAIPFLGGFNANALANTDTAYFSQFSYNGNDNKGVMLAANFDVDYDLGADHFFKNISFGARASDRKERDNFVGTYWAPISKNWIPYYAYLTGPNAHGTVSASDFSIYDFPNYFGGKVESPGAVLLPSAAMMQTYDWAHLASMSQDVATGSMNTQQYWDRYIDQNLGISNTDIQNRSAYVQARFGGEGVGFIPRFSGNIGVRVVNDVLRGSGNLKVDATQSFYLDQASANAAAFGQPFPNMSDLYTVATTSSTRTKKYGYTRVLPSFNVKFDVSRTTILRFAASETMSPPNLNDIRPGGRITANTVQVGTSGVYYLSNITSASGSNMKPVMIKNADISLEWYPKDGAYAYVDVFGKELTDQDLFTYYYQSQPTPLLKGTGAVPVTLDLPWFYQQNTSIYKAAKIRGFEVGGRKFFDELPDPFKGFGVSGSLTYVDSQNPALLANSVVGPYVPANNAQAVAGNTATDFKKMPYYGMSKWSYNVELYYNKGPWNARLAYNWHEKQLLSTNANPLSYNATGGNPYTCNSCGSLPVWQMVPLWSDDAGYLDFSLDYKVNDHISLGVQANNLTNTLSKTLQEPLPGVYERFDTYQTDRRVNAYLRLRY